MVGNNDDYTAWISYMANKTEVVVDKLGGKTSKQGGGKESHLTFSIKHAVTSAAEQHDVIVELT